MAKLSTWFKENKLSLNVKKTNYTIFNGRHGKFGGSSNYTTNLFMDNCPITRVKSSKFLGVIIEENLS